MAELTKEQVIDLYSTIKGFDNFDLKILLRDDLQNADFRVDSCQGSTLIEEANPLGVEMTIRPFAGDPFGEISRICAEYARKYSDSIINILRENRNSTEIVMDILLILAPAIAQEYSGIPAMAIVASVTVMARNGLLHILDGSNDIDKKDNNNL